MGGSYCHEALSKPKMNSSPWYGQQDVTRVAPTSRLKRNVC
jgi:hypothetical protein